MKSTCLFLMEVWMAEGPRVNFVMREALFEIYTWILCLSYLHEKQTSRIQSLYLYFIKIVPFWLWNIHYSIHNRAVFRTATGTAGSYVSGTASWKNGCQNFYVHRSRKHWKCKYFKVTSPLPQISKVLYDLSTRDISSNWLCYFDFSTCPLKYM